MFDNNNLNNNRSIFQAYSNLNIEKPCHVSCFKPFKTTFKKERDVTMAKSKYPKLEKITIE